MSAAAVDRAEVNQLMSCSGFCRWSRVSESLTLRLYRLLVPKAHPLPFFCFLKLMFSVISYKLTFPFPVSVGCSFAAMVDIHSLLLEVTDSEVSSQALTKK